MSEWKASEKYTHAEVRYSEGHGDERCGKCLHFIPPKSCEHVMSPIEPNYCVQTVCAKDSQAERDGPVTESLKDLFGTPNLMFTKEQMAIPEPKVFIGGQELVIEAQKPDIKEQRQAILKNRTMKASDKIKALRALGKR